jgi:hypothetical protein
MLVVHNIVIFLLFLPYNAELRFHESFQRGNIIAGGVI